MHFCSAEFIYFITKLLLNTHQAEYYINFFTEYHRKSIVERHFRVLSCWFNECKTIQNITNLEDLLQVFKQKANQTETQIDFEEYIQSRE